MYFMEKIMKIKLSGGSRMVLAVYFQRTLQIFADPTRWKRKKSVLGMMLCYFFYFFKPNNLSAFTLSFRLATLLGASFSPHLRHPIALKFSKSSKIFSG